MVDAINELVVVDQNNYQGQYIFIEKMISSAC